MIADIIKSTASQLSKNGVDEAQLLSEYAMADILGIPRLHLGEKRDDDLTDAQRDAFLQTGKRLAAHEPLQYILGETDFMGHTFKTDRRALIPRPETEELVERVLNTSSIWDLPHPRVTDVGTGSGCIAITLAIAHPNARCAAIDISVECIELARENAALHNIGSIEWVCSDLLESREPDSADVIVSNPPYIDSDKVEGLDRNVREYEPRRALDGGERGLTIISKLLRQALPALKPGGWIFLEIGDDQGSAIKEMLKINGFSEAEIHRDMAGRDRIASARGKGRTGNV